MRTDGRAARLTSVNKIPHEQIHKSEASIAHDFALLHVQYPLQELCKHCGKQLLAVSSSYSDRRPDRTLPC